MDHYDILEVSRSASKEVIKAAYKSLMQRYHPDRNPGDTKVAERAVKVSRAYEVLSDPEQRAEYDRSLELQLPAGESAAAVVAGAAKPVGNRRAAAKKSDSSWYVWVLLLLIIGSAWLILAREKNTMPPELELRQLRLELTDKNLTPTQTQVKQKRVDEILRRHPALLQKEQQAKTESDTARVLPAYISDLSVKLKIEDLSYMFSDLGLAAAGSGDATGARKSSELAKQYKESGRVLFIPEMTVKIGTYDAETVLKHLESKRELIASRLAEKLGFAQYDELLKVSGEKYLVEMILDSIGETTGTDRHREFPANEFEAPARYGVIEVKLPASYSVN